jgi:hypothetical protein
LKRFALFLLGLVVIFGVIVLYHQYQDSFLNPNDAVSEHISRITNNTPGEVENFTIVSSTPRDGNNSELVLLFRASGKGSDIHIAGYAIVKKSLFGWHVEYSQMAGKSPLPDDILVNSSSTDHGQVIFGQVFLANASTIEAVFLDPNSGQNIVQEEIPTGNFVLFGPQYGDLLEIRLLDHDGNILKRFTHDELQSG